METVGAVLFIIVGVLLVLFTRKFFQLGGDEPKREPSRYSLVIARIVGILFVAGAVARLITGG